MPVSNTTTIFSTTKTFSVVSQLQGQFALWIYFVASVLKHLSQKSHLNFSFFCVHFNDEVFLELSNDENLLRKILLLIIGNFYEGSIDHIIMDNLIKHNLIIIIMIVITVNLKNQSFLAQSITKYLLRCVGRSLSMCSKQ